VVRAANATDPRAHVLVLLAGEAGLRLGKMVALEWGGIDFNKGQCACTDRRGRGRSRRRKAADYDTCH
jgi:site-specific recombinase XerC